MKIERNPFRDYTAESALFVRRALVAFLVILVLSGILIANLYNLQVVRVEDYRTRSNENRIKLVPIAPSRGIIYDRNGTPLALNRTIYQLELMPEKVDDLKATLQALRTVVDLTDDDITNFEKERKLQQLQQEDVEPVILLRTLQRELLLLLTLQRRMASAPLRTLFDQHKVWQNRRPLVTQALQRLSGAQLQQAVQLLTQIELTLKQDYGQSVWPELETLSMLLCGKPLATSFTDAH